MENKMTLYGTFFHMNKIIDNWLIIFYKVKSGSTAVITNCIRNDYSWNCGGFFYYAF